MSFMDIGDATNIGISTSCLICDASVPAHSIYDHHKICDDCKEAITILKQRLKEENNDV